MKILSKILIAMTLIAGLSLSSNSVQAESQMIDLGTLGGTSSLARDINNNNQIVGIITFGRRHSHAFLWENDVMTDLTPEYDSYASAINANGQIVGSSFITGDQHATLWKNGEEIDLGTLYGNTSIAYDINDHDQVVGAFRFTDGVSNVPRAFLWDQGTMVDLGTLGGNASEAHSINNRGEIVGWSTNAQGISRPFLWKDGAMIDLGTLGGLYGGAKSINSSSRIVGSTASELSQSRPTLWFHNQVTDLDFSYQEFSPEHISNSGNIVGYYRTDSNDIRAFVWFNKSFSELGTLGGTYGVAWSVNDKGYVVGGSSTQGGYIHAYLWIP